MPFTLAEIQSRLKILTTYRIDIFFAGPKGIIPLWANDAGYRQAGLDYLIERSKQYHERRRQERTLKKGDRVAVLGRGIAVIEHADETEVHALLRNRIMLKMRRRDIVRSRQNIRWEAEVLAP
jgi:preprotein translocase subunit YajC